MTIRHNWQNTMLGRYRLMRPLQQSEVGEVWLAEDTQLQRQVAARLLPVVRTADSEYLQAFEREVRVAATLEHPNILPVHDFGEQRLAENEVVTYLIIPYIAGGSLQDRIRSAAGPLPIIEALGYLRQAALAIDYAHRRQVIHRDIRPANMLLQQSRLFLTNFGLAKVLTSGTQRNRTHVGGGAPEYIAPEQAQGKAEPASDRYSFAVIAYQLLSGKLPFTGETPYSILIKQVNEAPPSPRQFNAALPEEAEAAILQGLAKAPGERPATCMALVERLERVWKIDLSSSHALSGAAPGPDSATASTQAASFASAELYPHDAPTQRSDHLQATLPVTPELTDLNAQDAPTALSNRLHPASDAPAAYPQDAPTQRSDRIAQRIPEISAEERARRATTRRAVLLGGGAVVALAAIGGAGWLASMYIHLSSTPGSSAAGTATPVARPRLTPGPAKLAPGSPLLSLTGHTQEVAVAKWDPTGRYLATGGLDSAIMLWDIASALQQSASGIQSLSTPLRSWKLPNPVYANRLCWSADGRTLAAIMDDKQANSKVALYDAFSNADKPRAIYHIDDTTGGKLFYTAIDWSPTASIFATPSYRTGQSQQRVNLWRVGNTTTPLRTLTAESRGAPRTITFDDFDPLSSDANVNTVAWSSDGTLLAGHTNFGTVTLWETATGNVKGELHLPVRPIPLKQTPAENGALQVENESLAWSPTQPRMLAVSNIDVVTIWDTRQQTLLHTLTLNSPIYSLTDVIWSSNGRYVAASGAGSGRVYVWDLQAASNPQGDTLKPLSFFPQGNIQIHKSSISAIDWSPDGRYIVSASADTTAVVWKVGE